MPLFGGGVVCVECLAVAAPPVESSRYQTRGHARWIGLGVVAAGVALIIIDATIVNVALPTIIPDLDLGLSGAEWVNSIYSLVFAALLIALLTASVGPSAAAAAPTIRPVNGSPQTNFEKIPAA